MIVSPQFQTVLGEHARNPLEIATKDQIRPDPTLRVYKAHWSAL